MMVMRSGERGKGKGKGKGRRRIRDIIGLIIGRSRIDWVR